MMKASKKRAKHEFVVGYSGDWQCLYGRESLRQGSYCTFSVDRLTAHQARRLQKQMPCKGARIYRLVDVTDEMVGDAQRQGK